MFACPSSCFSYAATKDITYTGYHLVILFLGVQKGMKKQSNPSENKVIIEEKKSAQ